MHYSMLRPCNILFYPMIEAQLTLVLCDEVSRHRFHTPTPTLLQGILAPGIDIFSFNTGSIQIFIIFMNITITVASLDFIINTTHSENSLYLKKKFLRVAFFKKNTCIPEVGIVGFFFYE